MLPKKKKNLSLKNTNVQNIDQTLTWLLIYHPKCVIIFNSCFKLYIYKLSWVSQVNFDYLLPVNGYQWQLTFFFEILLAILPSGSHMITGYGFSIREATIDDLQLAFKQNQLTSRQLVEFYIGEIRKLNPVLHGVILVNPDALHEADKADHERNAKAPRSLSGLHGIPI